MDTVGNCEVFQQGSSQSWQRRIEPTSGKSHTDSDGTDKANMGQIYTQKLNPKLGPQDFTAANLTLMIAEGRKLTDGLLQVCEVDINSRSSTVSLTRDLRFNIKTAPSRLVIPIESTLTPSLSLVATGSNSRAFPKDAITIAGRDYHSVCVLVATNLE